MTQKTKVLIGQSPERPVMWLQESEAWIEFRQGENVEKGSSTIGKVLAAMQAVPDLLLGQAVNGKRLMEVVINGDLTMAADGNGFRGFAMGAKGIKEHARLFDLDNLNKLVDAALVWRIASVVVAQKHLHDINQNLVEIKEAIHSVAQFQRDEQRSRIESCFEYLLQISASVQEGERGTAVRNRLENIEAEMDAIQRHLKNLFDGKLGLKIVHDEMLGADKLGTDIDVKIVALNKLLQDYLLAGMTRAGALQMLVLFPGESTLKKGRRESVIKSAEVARTMSDDFIKGLSAEIDGMNTVWEPAKQFLLDSFSPFHFFANPRSLLVTLATNLATNQATTKSFTPQLDALKQSLRERLSPTVRKTEDRVNHVIGVCNSVEGLLRPVQPVRYLVDWRDGKPHQIKEVNGTKPPGSS